MPRVVTMSTIVTACEQRANMEGDSSISLSEKKARISGAYGELYEDVSGTGLRYFEYSTTFVTAGLAYIAEPVDHLSTVDTIELVLDTATGRCVRLKPIGPAEHSRWAGVTGTPRYYDMIDDRFYLYPKPVSGKTLTLRYIPQPPDLTSYADGDVVDVVTPSGFDFIVWSVALTMMSKDKSDVQLAMAERERLRARVIDWATYRYMNERPRQYVDDQIDDMRDSRLFREGGWFDR